MYLTPFNVVKRWLKSGLSRPEGSYQTEPAGFEKKKSTGEMGIGGGGGDRHPTMVGGGGRHPTGGWGE